MKKYIDEYFPIAFLYALSIYFMLDVEDFTADSLLYPRGLAWILLALTTLLLIFTVAKKIRLPQSKDETVSSKFYVIFAASVAYVAMVPFLGFVVSSLLFCPATALTLGYKRKGMAFLISAIAVGLIYVGFKMILKVPLPTMTVFGMTL